MKQSAYKELAEVENHYWWHLGRNIIIDKQLARINPRHSKLKVLNVGAGTGGTIQTLEKQGQVTNIDTSKEAIRYLKLRKYDAKLFDGKKLPFANESFDIVAALDVLEHIDDDKASVKDWMRVVRPGGALLITVPAYQWLWSDHDEVNMHFRRYTKRNLRSVIKNSGKYKIQKLSYMIVFSLPLIIGHRMIKKLSSKKTGQASNKTNFVPVPHQVNNFFVNLLGLEALLQQRIDFPFGSSLIAVVVKAEH